MHNMTGPSEDFGRTKRRRLKSVKLLSAVEGTNLDFSGRAKVLNLSQRLLYGMARLLIEGVKGASIQEMLRMVPVVFKIYSDASKTFLGLCFDAIHGKLRGFCIERIWRQKQSQLSVRMLKTALREKVKIDIRGLVVIVTEQPLEIQVEMDEIIQGFRYSYYSLLTGYALSTLYSEKTNDANCVVVIGLKPSLLFSYPFGRTIGNKSYGDIVLKFKNENNKAYHPQNRMDSREEPFRTLEDMLRACALEWTGAAWMNIYACRNVVDRTPIARISSEKRLIEGPGAHEITTEQRVFQDGDREFLRFSPFKGVKRFGSGKLSPRFIIFSFEDFGTY
ncbi:hypothetical protein Tco_1032624 [Tanacetum coccineum]|uniref:Uncharacterized protein n=1 Tax=Tanacetum coccineum TaxID=301880 RepID=A0ABQ5GDF5_9ASTR